MNEVREALRDLLSEQRWDAFFTSTFARPQRYSHTAIDKVERALSTPRLRPVKMFIAAEPHYLGNWHCHGLIELPRDGSGNLFHGEDILAFQKNNLSQLGFNKVDIVDSINACSLYLSKYLVKDEWHGDWKMTGRKKFWSVQ